MSIFRPRMILTTWLLFMVVAPLGCSPNESGSIDLKKGADSPAQGKPGVRAFRKGDLEER